MSKRFIYIGFLLSIVNVGEAMAVCSSANQLQDAVALNSLLSGRTVCVGSTGNWEAQEIHSPDGLLIDYKRGPSHPVDPTRPIGNWNVAGAGTNTKVFYSYTAGGSFSYTVHTGPGGFSFCNGATEIIVNKIVPAGSC